MLLYRAEGSMNLGKFDEASVIYENVLRADPTNKAARRGMERVAAARTDYYRAAYDQARAEMLSQVDQAWELQVPASGSMVSPLIVNESNKALYINKLKSIIIPRIALDDVSISEAVDFLRQQSVELDTNELDSAARGINIVLEIGNENSDIGNQIRGRRFNLNLANVPLGKALEYICETTETVMVEQPFAVVIRPAGADSPDMIVRSYRVPPDFLSVGSTEVDGGGEENDPFAMEPQASALASRLTAEEILRNRGVSFPEGASASFNSASSTLRVRNTLRNQSVVEQIVDILANDEPAAVVIEVKIIKVQKRHHEELSFDWLLGDQSLGGTGIVPGSDAVFLTGGTVGNGNPLGGMQLPVGPLTRNPLTAGNRSGDQAINGDSIDKRILESTQGFAGRARRAPGVFQVTGLVNNSYVTMMMRGLDRKTGVDLTAVPSVVTRSGQAAVVKIVDEFIYPTSYEPPQLPNSTGGGNNGNIGGGGGGGGGQSPVTPANPTDFVTRDLGIILEVLPTVSKDKRSVDISLKPSITNFEGFVNYGSPIMSPQSTSLFGGLGIFGFLDDDEGVVITENRILMPVISDMSTETALTIYDGQTIVMSGLMEERIQIVEDKTPILGDIPLVGRLFQSRASSPIQTRVIFLIKVKVVDAAGRPFNP